MNNIKKFSWEFNDHAEIWDNDTHDTVKDCIIDAQCAISNLDYEGEPPTAVYIGENVAFVPWVDPEIVLDNIQEQAYEFAGEVGGDWCAYDYKKQEELDELAHSLSLAVNKWLKNYGYSPSLYAIQKIKKYPLAKMEESP